MDEGLVIVCEAEDGVELVLIRQMLQEAGIQCITKHDPQIGMPRYLPRQFIQVLPQDASQARVLIADFRAESAAGTLAVSDPEASDTPDETETPPGRTFSIWPLLFALIVAVLLLLRLYPLLNALFNGLLPHHY